VIVKVYFSSERINVIAGYLRYTLCTYVEHAFGDSLVSCVDDYLLLTVNKHPFSKVVLQTY